MAVRRRRGSTPKQNELIRAAWTGVDTAEIDALEAAELTDAEAWYQAKASGLAAVLPGGGGDTQYAVQVPSGLYERELRQLAPDPAGLEHISKALARWLSKDRLAFTARLDESQAFGRDWSSLGERCDDARAIIHPQQAVVVVQHQVAAKLRLHLQQPRRQAQRGALRLFDGLGTLQQVGIKV